MPLSSIGRDVTYGEAAALIIELMKETGSHLVADMRGYTQYVASTVDLAMLTLAEWFVNVHRDPKKRAKPFEFPRPWPTVPEKPKVSAAERESIEADWRGRSAFSN